MARMIVSFLIMAVLTMFFGFACADQKNSVNLNGRWKMIDYKAPNVLDYYLKLVKKNMGEEVQIINDVVEVKLMDQNFKFKLHEPPSFLPKIKSAYFNQSDPGALDLGDFSFGDDVFNFMTEKINNAPRLRRIIVDGGGEKMILAFDGAYFLFARQESEKR